VKAIKSLAAIITVTAIIASVPMSVNATPMQTIKVSVISQNLVISKQDIKEISVLKDGNTPGVTITLKDAAAKKLSQLTGSNIQKKLQLSIGDHIISEPVIQGKLGAQFQLTTKSEKMANEIYKALSS
jgi:preprotein translocase subunit SecD